MIKSDIGYLISKDRAAALRDAIEKEEKLEIDPDLKNIILDALRDELIVVETELDEYKAGKTENGKPAV